MSDPGKAVFLSYASQDAEAAKKICEALRAAGVEVWFDQNELVGGDAWDQKIRKQIKECALLIPIISQSTQARTEGYFRLEWRLADQRTHLMAKGRPFLLPVVIDDTKDADAHVPDSFLEVQWSRISGGACDPTFAAHVKRLLDWDGGSGSRPAKPSAATPKTPPSRRTRPITYGVLTAIVIGLAAATWVATRPKAGTTSSAPAVSTTPSASEADKLVQQARALVDDDPLTVRANFRTALQLGERAIALDPGHAGAYAIAARAGLELIDRYNAGALVSVAKVRGWAESAIRLAPDSIEAGLALAAVDLATNTRLAEVEQRLGLLLQRAPEDRRILRGLQEAAAKQNKLDQADKWIDRALSLPGSDAESLAFRAIMKWGQNRYPEMATALEQSLALKTTAWACHSKLMLLVWGLGDMEGGRRWVQQMPAALLQEDRVAYLAFLTWYWSRRPDEALEALRGFSEPFIEENALFASTSYLRGCAHALAGRSAAAKSEFTKGLQEINERLAQDQNNLGYLLQKFRLQSRLGKQDEALQTRLLLKELASSRGSNMGTSAEVLLLTGSPAEAIEAAERSINPKQSRWPIRVNELRFDPVFDPLRGDPRFQAIVARGEAQLAELSAEIGSDAKDGGGPRPPSPNPGLSQQPSTDAKSVAVLAFANLSSDKEQEYFSDGISEELLNVLTKVPGLKVTARTSSFFFKGKEVPIPEIARQLGVAYVIEGSVRKAGDKVRITAQLIKAADGFHVWSDTFTRDLKDIFAVQDEIAGLIAQQLQLKLDGSARATKQVDPEAYDLFLRARALSRVVDENYAPIIGLYEAAVAKDPNFALAYVQLSIIRGYDYWAGAVDSKPAALAALQAAQRLAPDAPETRLAAGSYAYCCETDWNLARTEFLAAQAGLPGDAQVAFYLGMVHRRLLSLDESLRQVARAIELDPADKNSFLQQAHTLRSLRRYPELVELMAAALKRFPADPDFLQNQSFARCEIDRDQAAYLRRVRELPAVDSRAQVLKDYFLAMNAGEWEAAGRILAGANLDYLSNTPASTRDPVALQQALVAHLQGRPEQAQRYGTEALAYYATQQWSLRQDKWMKLGQALALAYVGRGAEAMEQARATLTATARRDAWDAVMLHAQVARVYLVLGRRDEAFAQLRIMMSGPCIDGTEELRRDPLWRTVKDDPRFEEILRSAQRL